MYFSIFYITHLISYSTYLEKQAVSQPTVYVKRIITYIRNKG